MLFLISGLLLALLLTVLALRRPDARRRVWRVAAGLGAVAGLGLAAFPPVQEQAGPARPTTAILLTASYSPDTLRALLRRLGPTTPVYRRYGAAAPAGNDTLTLPNATAIGLLLPGLRELHVLGRGLPAADVPALPGLPLRLHADAPAAGFQQATWDAQPELGQPWSVAGQLAKVGNGPVWVRLRAAGAVRDSVRLPAGGGPFELRFVPRATGRAVYGLEARQGARLVAREPVPVEVQAPQPLRVLVLAAAPSFELRFLKEYLAAHQHTVAVRTGLSRGLTQTEFLNLPNPPALGRLTPALLARFEVVVTDAASLAGLGGAEAATLQRAVREGTCGVLLVADTPTLPRQLPGASAFRVQLRSAAAALVAQPLRWPAAPAAAALVPATLRPTTALRALISGPDRQPVAAARALGLGTVVVSTITESFPWALQNKAATYAAYWSRLLTAARPVRRMSGAIQGLNSWPTPNEPLHLRTVGAGSASLWLAAPATDTLRLAQRPDAWVAEWATATYWPAVAGWHQARVGTVRQWFYVYGSPQWAGPRRQQWQRAAALAPAGPGAEAATTVAVPGRRTTWPRWWGYALFLLAAGFLWLEEKL
ncbi:hypothetical protein [Hymenobacter rubripertinctus]|uniref:Uncharacterized protein n=1 Tax=Hymenobacter rubripertinctus TaxID=2029981 RepID=A0A418QRG2_9BACT|nr:hypothetical protein [Hymenobacter rubripertinctus]RIY07806.1 hypothetical protein D0T11_15635 [Hymenobacter rubripertinctus]